MDTEEAASPPRSSLEVLENPWAFTQHHPLGTDDFIKEAKRRSVELDLTVLRELYRLGVLPPLIEIMSRRVGDPIQRSEIEQTGYSTLDAELRRAAAAGRVRDPAAAPFRRHVPFERPRNAPRQWLNGLIYSHFQLLACPEIESLLPLRRVTLRGKRRIVRFPELSPWFVQRAHRLRDLVIVLAGLEARYRPSLDQGWIQLVNTDVELWERYRESFDPRDFAAVHNYPAEQARKDAEWLLMTAHRIDPFESEWASLVRRASRAARDKLTGAALQAVDCRGAAEILLLYYEDLVSRGAAEPLPDNFGFSWHPLADRLSARRQTLDEDLRDLGLSPHPRVVLVVEGETEETLVPRVREYADLPVAPELIRILTLRGVGGDLTKVAALAAAPLVGERHGQAWSLIKPPTMLFVAVDPEGPYQTPEGVVEVREKILEEIRRVLAAQGVTADPADLDDLVRIHVWQERCFEFEHFEDDELAEAIVRVHNGWPRVSVDQVRRAVGQARRLRRNIDEVWSNWRPKFSKPALGAELWAALAAKIDRRRADHTAPLPPIAEVLIEADQLARRWQYGSFVLRSAPPAD